MTLCLTIVKPSSDGLISSWRYLVTKNTSLSGVKPGVFARKVFIFTFSLLINCVRLVCSKHQRKQSPLNFCTHFYLNVIELFLADRPFCCSCVYKTWFLNSRADIHAFRTRAGRFRLRHWLVTVCDGSLISANIKRACSKGGFIWITLFTGSLSFQNIGFPNSCSLDSNLSNEALKVSKVWTTGPEFKLQVLHFQMSGKCGCLGEGQTHHWAI